MSKTITDKDLMEYRRNKQVNRQQASRLLRARNSEPQPAATDQLVVSVTEAVQGANEMNRNALNLIQRMFQKLTMTQPVIPAPQVYIPDSPKRWRFTIKRDSDGLIAEVLAERLDDSMPSEGDM